jgi:integrase/recombinase XerD
MLSKFFKSRERIYAFRDGPGGLLLEGFAQALSERGYATITARRYLRAAEHFIHLTHRHGIPVGELNEQSLARFARHLRRCRCLHYAHANPARVVHCARVFLAHLRDAGIITASAITKVVDDPVLLSAFCQWMRQQRGSCEATL